MKKRPYFKTAQTVVDFFDKNRKLSSFEIGKMLGLHPAYVRKALQRNGRRLARAKR